jgi:pilus assembly protein CpaF
VRTFPAECGDAPARLEMIILMGNANMPLVAIRPQIASSVQMLVQTARLSDGARRVVSIAEVTGIKDDEITTDDLFVFEKHGIDHQGKVVGVWWRVRSVPISTRG